METRGHGETAGPPQGDTDFSDAGRHRRNHIQDLQNRVCIHINLVRSLLLLQRLRQVAMPASWEEPWLSIRMAKFCAVDTPTLISLSQETKLL